MGLDMYLAAKRTVADEAIAKRLTDLLASVKRFDDEDEYYLSMWQHGDSGEAAANAHIVDLAGLTPLMGAESNSGSAKITDEGVEVGVTVAYWRKANAIHGWFVDHVQGGVDECQEAEVHPELLAELMQTCERAIAGFKDGTDPKAEILPPRAGFFFGSYEPDAWYLQDLEQTVSELRRVIEAAAAIGGVRFFYHSSW